MDALEEVRLSLCASTTGMSSLGPVPGVFFSWIGSDIFHIGGADKLWSAFRRRLLLRLKNNNNRNPNVNDIGTMTAAAIQRFLGLVTELFASEVLLTTAVELDVALGEMLGFSTVCVLEGLPLCMSIVRFCDCFCVP